MGQGLAVAAATRVFEASAVDGTTACLVGKVVASSYRCFLGCFESS